MGTRDLDPNHGAKLTSTITSAKRQAWGLSKRRRASSLASALFRRRTWLIPLATNLAFLLVYAANPSESNPAHPFIFLSYKLGDDATDNDSSSLPPQYGKGLRDIAYVCFYTVFLTFTREACMREILSPLARRRGIQSRAKRARFAENTYTALYITVIAPWGMYLMHRTPVWYFNTRGMYEGYPHHAHEAGFKSYYLLQAAFWMQQVVVMVLGLEARRKDFNQLIAHHVVTVALVALSYRFHFAYMGIAVYITHDVSDFFLSVSKSLNYFDSPAQGWSFALCIAMWIYLRHYINLRILYSALPGGEFSTVGPYVLDWAAEQYKGPLANVITFSLLAALQALNIFWLYCLLRCACKFVFLGVAQDDRSEIEDEGQEAENSSAGYVEKEVHDGSFATVVGGADTNVPDAAAGNGLAYGLVQRRGGQS
ncbi:TLC domain-containing protein [Colletotrichum sojae]|uniref:TLC domain-containing protein n=1 Tax=Colletotrichum sojae TaxID=2175907 RepID=A0A8H6IUY7_9PEZI|nr:TLC domain-containing protein [Colletotrichum sojae]